MMHSSRKILLSGDTELTSAAGSGCRQRNRLKDQQLATVTHLDFLRVPRELIGQLKPRDLVVFAFLFTARDMATDYVWQTKIAIGAATGYGRFAVEAAILHLQRERLVRVAERLEE